MEKNIFIFDENKCVGCHACVVACMNENGSQEPKQWRNIHKSQDHHFPELPLFHLSLACNHCDDSPCLKNCPALAYSRDEKTGAVIHDPEKCIGCKYCTWACPYDAPKYNPKTGVVEKCTFCNHRIEEGLKPACANLCPLGALDFANISFSREESKKSSPVPVDVGSNIKINKLRAKKAPLTDTELFKEQTSQIKPKKGHEKISAIEEWPLIVFTLIASILVSLYASEKIAMFSFLQKHIFIGFGIVAAVFSMLHLGQKFRAWRSLINIKNSWLSKEIALFGLFFTTAFCDFYIFDLPNILITGIGIMFLFSIDMLYRIAAWRWPLKTHSAQTIFIALSLFAFFSQQLPLFYALIALRAALYIYRKSQMLNKSGFISIARISFFALPVLLMLIGLPYYFPLIVLLFGEIIDRIEFYNELNVPDPKEEFSR